MAYKIEDSTITVTKLVGVEWLRRANSFTTGKDSKMSLRKAYAYCHSPIRTQIFFIELENIPLFCASQFVRSKIGVEWWMKSKRTDRGGENFIIVCNDLSRDLYDIINGVYDKGMGDEPFEYHEDDEPNLAFIADEIEGLPKRFDRYAPTDLCCMINAEEIMNMSHKRLCASASKETRELWQVVLEKVRMVDPDLYPFCVKPCVAYGLCREPKPCGYMNTENYRNARQSYLKLFE